MSVVQKLLSHQVVCKYRETKQSITILTIINYLHICVITHIFGHLRTKCLDTARILRVMCNVVHAFFPAGNAGTVYTVYVLSI